MKLSTITARARCISASTIKACAEFASESKKVANETRAAKSKLSPKPRFAIFATKILAKLPRFARKPKLELTREIEETASLDFLSIVEMLGEKLCAIEEQLIALRADVQNIAFMHEPNSQDSAKIAATRQLQAELSPKGLSYFSNRSVTAVRTDIKDIDSEKGAGKSPPGT